MVNPLSIFFLQGVYSPKHAFILVQQELSKSLI